MKVKLLNVIGAAICFAFCASTGAYAATLTLTKTADTNDGVCDADCSLREAIAAAASGDTIQFALTTPATITLDSSLGELVVDKSLTISGPGADQLSISGGDAVRVFHLKAGTGTFDISGVTVMHGFDNGVVNESSGAGRGAGLFNESASKLTITNCTFSYNNATGSGNKTGRAGAIFDITNSDIVITGSTFDHNSAAGEFGAQGGAIDTSASGTLTIQGNSVFSNNSATALFSQTLGGTPPASSGAINVYQTILTITNSTFTGNTATGSSAFGGVLTANAGFTISGCSFTGNAALSDGVNGDTSYGGALIIGQIGASGTITNTTFEQNSAAVASGGGTSGYCYGGAIVDEHFGFVSNSTYVSVTLDGCTFKNNTAAADGGETGAGAIYSIGTAGGSDPSQGALIIKNTTLSANSAVITGANNGFGLTYGGAITAANTGWVVISGTSNAPTSLTDNYADGPAANQGGAIVNYATVNLSGVTISGNQATTGTSAGQGFGGAIYNNGTLSVDSTWMHDNTASTSATTGAVAGAIYNSGGTLTIRSSALTANAVSCTSSAPSCRAFAGAVDTDGGTVNVINSTIGNNSATTTGGLGGFGGGIYNNQGTLNLDNSTIAGNSVSGGSSSEGGGVYENGNTATATVKNTMIATNTSTFQEPDIRGAFTSGGYNLIGNASGTNSGFSSATNDIVGTDPKLADLGNYNGPTPTFALIAGSPAIDAGDPNFDANAFTPALTGDQRGMARVRDARIDIGAYEAPAPPTITKPAAGGYTTGSVDLAATAEAFATVIFTITDASQGTTTVTRIADANGNVTATQTLAEGSYSISATAEVFSELPSNPSAARSFTVDTHAPQISNVPADTTVEASGPSGATVTYSSPTASDNVDGSMPVTCSPASGSTFALGQTTVNCSATDRAGNKATAQFSVTVQDTTPPQISNVPADITTTATSSNGAVVTYNNPTATDAVSGNVPVNCNPPSGSTFPVGTTTVTCTAKDAANNTSQATFKVTVQEASPTPAPSATATATPTASPTATPTASPTATATATPSPTASPTATPSSTPAQALNLSTRGDTLTGENVMIGGFIITGNAPKKVVVRAIGPSTGMAGALADPVLELHGPSGFSTQTNDNWQDASNASEIPPALQPKNPNESAILITLDPGAYTGIVRGKNNTTGIALVEVYDVSSDVPSQLANISTRAFVQTQDNVLIGGFILSGGSGNTSNVIVRALGPSLADQGVANPLADPVLEVHNNDGSLVVTNDNWRDDANSAQVTQAGIPPKSDLESALYLSLPPGEYTAIVSGKGNNGGVGLVEIYHLP